VTPARIDSTLAALADPTRRAVIDLLRRKPLPAGELAFALDASAPALSRHLRVLRREGLVEESRDERDARLRIYQLRREPFDELKDWIAKVETFWADQLESYREHVGRKERRRRK
jgi:DNA-binding transcriptional ArsR family regulator